jgi:prepilin-type processing-associated H-X9-DG protein
MMRAQAAATECKQKLGDIGNGLINYAGLHKAFPKGTIGPNDLPPEKRLSWFTRNWGFMVQGERLNLNEDQPWDSEGNLDPKATVFESGPTLMNVGEIAVGIWRQVRCPADDNPGIVGKIGITNYVGITGIGGDYAATLPISDPWAGFFGYDRKCRREDITNGLSKTMAVAETRTDNGPWTAGGRPTVRGLDQDRSAYLGKEGQFNSGHYSRSFFTRTKDSYTTNILFADGSVRSFTDDIDPATFGGMATIHAPIGGQGE